ncbi:hypothetical protein, partial [Xanthomonas arboricola]
MSRLPSLSSLCLAIACSALLAMARHREE